MGSTSTRDVEAIPFGEVRRWMFDVALPLWADQGVDRVDGGFVEQLDFAGRDKGLDYKRTRVTCRQIYVFSHAAILGWKDGLKIAEHGVSFLRKAWLGPDGGWARTLTRDGAVKDGTPDLYDIAFALFALGWYVRATGDEEAAALARQTLTFAQTHMRGPNGEGFLHEKPAAGWRQQNPHMHMLEAALSCFEATQDGRYGDQAIELTHLFRDRFFDPRTRTLAEYFADDWSRAQGDAGRIIEPGHQFEWAWILANQNRLLGTDTGDLIRGLVDFAERYGVDPATAATFNQVRDDGNPIDRGSRTWPNTERVKGHIALYDMFGESPQRAVAGSTRLLLDRYLATERPGLWIDLFDASGAPQSANVPTSTLYHVFLAFAEVLRLEQKSGSPRTD